ncbi:MAG: phytase [Oligoflexus sp.]
MRLTDDVEGISIYRKNATDGYIIVSSQGISEFLVFDRRRLVPLGSFQAQFGNDPITNTDGIHVQSGSFGKGFESGLIVFHDDENRDETGW